jgi:hypothetical protein
MECLHLEVGAVTWNKKPVAYLFAKQIDSSDRREFAPEFRIFRIDSLRDNKPDTVVARRFLMISKHTKEPIPRVNRKPRKHPAHLRIQGRERFQHKSVRELLSRSGGRDMSHGDGK